MDRVLVVGLGNPILTDDAVGITVVEKLRPRFHGRPVDFVEASVGGLDLLDLLSGYHAALLVDAIVTGRARPGEVLDLDPRFLEDTSRLGTTGVSHQIDLATAWQLGRRLGLSLPEHIHILGVEAGDVKTFSERLSPEVEVALPEVVEAVAGRLEVLLALLGGRSEVDGPARARPDA